MRFRNVCVQFLMVLAFLFLPAALVSADQSPPSCNSSNLDLTLTKNKTIVRQGDTITYSVYITNQDNGSSIACDITNATTTVTLPAADGTPTGQVVTIATGANYLAGTSSTFIGSANYAVAVNPGVTDVVAQARVSGTLHDAPVNHTAEITKTVGTSITQPHLTLTKAANPTTGQARLVTTYTYQLTNDSTTNASMTSVTLTDDQCSPLNLTTGDVNSNGVLDRTETWTYTCTKTITIPGTYTNTATAQAINSEDGLPVGPVSTTATVRVIGGLPGLPKTGDGSTALSWGELFQKFAAISFMTLKTIV